MHSPILKVVNEHTEVAELFDDNERGDRVYADFGRIGRPNAHVEHTFRVVLKSSAPTGAIIGLEVFFENEQGETISSPRHLLATVEPAL